MSRHVRVSNLDQLSVKDRELLMDCLADIAAYCDLSNKIEAFKDDMFMHETLETAAMSVYARFPAQIRWK